jgi:alcohol dehydrogenase YqhD (iron-dependent ADH family)
MLSKFEFTTAILFGAGVINKVGEEAAKLGDKVMVVTYPDIRRIGLLDKVLKNLKESKLDVVVFEKVEPNPRTTTLEEGAAIARMEKIDLVIGLGGGSVMDSAKGIALASSGIASIWDYMINQAEVKGVVPPIIQVPTMAGSGAEMTSGAVLTNWEMHVKKPVGHPRLQAKVAIIDPEITLSVPLHQTKAGGVDILFHVLEPYLTDAAPTMLTDGIRETCMKMVVKYLPRAIAHLDDLEARTQLSWASTIATSQIGLLGGGGGSPTCHGIEHALSGYYDLTHGDGLAALFPAWMKSFNKVREDRFKSLGKNVFGKEDGLNAIEEFLERVGMKLRLGKLGCKLQHAQVIAELTIKSSPMLNDHPTPLDTNAIVKIFQDSF